MFSALKRLTRSNTDGNSVNSAGHQVLPQSLQKKFAKGIQYNMKIILKGDRNSGKSSLFRRLQGLPFKEEYNPTNEIQSANIQWNYKATDDVVKVEIWDVVDKAKKKKQVSQTLKLENVEAPRTDESAQMEELALDASFLNVYKNTHGVILIFDITKNWTFDYVKREISLIPTYMPILILGNHRDMGHHRAISKDTVLFFIESLERKPGSGEIRYCESSMRNGFGLKFIHKFFNLPFLHLQKETLLKQLATNAEENLVTIEELNLYMEGDESNYDFFIDGLTQKRRQVADALSAPVPKISIEEAQALAALKEKESTTSGSSSITSGNSNNTNPGLISKGQEVITPVLPHLSQEPTSQKSTGRETTHSSELKAIEKVEVPQPKAQPLDPVEDFIPDESGVIEGSFFTEGLTTKFETLSTKSDGFESSDEDIQGNPMVTSYMEDIEPDYHVSNNITIMHHTETHSSDEHEAHVVSTRETKSSLSHGGSSPEINKKREKNRKKGKSKDSHRHRQDSSNGTKKQINLETFLNGDPEDRSRSIEPEEYEQL